MPVTNLLALCVVFAQVAGGGIVWMWIRRDHKTPLIEIVGMGLAVGTLLSLVGSQFTIGLSLGGIGWVLPIVTGVCILSLTSVGMEWRKRVTFGAASQWASLGIVCGIGILTLIPGTLRTPQRDGYVTGARYHGDLVFFEAVAQFLSRTGPGDSSLLSGFGIRYHWFAYGWIGSLTDVIGAEPFFVMTRVFPSVMVVGASALAVAWAARLSSRQWTPLLAGLLVVVAGFIGAEQGAVVNFDSPSTTYAAVLALAFGLALTNFLSQQVRSPASTWKQVLLLGFLAAGTVGAKASQAAVIACGLCAMAIASSRMQRPFRGRVWLALGAGGTAMVLAYIVVLAGVAPSESNIAFSLVGEKASTFQGLDPFEGAVGGLLGSLVLVLAILPRWIGAAWLPHLQRPGLKPETAFGVGIAVAGILPLILLSSGTNAGWFAVAASPILGVLSAVGLERALGHVGGSSARFLICAGLSAIALNLAVFVNFALGAVSGAPVLWRGPVIAWVLALLLAVPVAALANSESQKWIRWLAAVTTILVLASIGSRISGASVWTVTQVQLTPSLQQFVLWTDPSAEFPGGSQTSSQGAARSPDEAQTTVASSIGVAGTVNGLLQWSPELNRAALWLEPQVEAGTHVAVDATYLQPFLPVVTDVSMYVAGEPYMSGYTTREGTKIAAARQALVRNFLDEPSPFTAREMWKDGVRWLWLQQTPKDARDEFMPWATVEYIADQVTILRLNDPGANFG